MRTSVSFGNRVDGVVVGLTAEDEPHEGFRLVEQRVDQRAKAEMKQFRIVAKRVLALPSYRDSGDPPTWQHCRESVTSWLSARARIAVPGVRSAMTRTTYQFGLGPGVQAGQGARARMFQAREGNGGRLGHATVARPTSAFRMRPRKRVRRPLAHWGRFSGTFVGLTSRDPARHSPCKRSATLTFACAKVSPPCGAPPIRPNRGGDAGIRTLMVALSVGEIRELSKGIG